MHNAWKYTFMRIEDIEDERDACVEWVIKGKEEITGIT